MHNLSFEIDKKGNINTVKYPDNVTTVVHTLEECLNKKNYDMCFNLKKPIDNRYYSQTNTGYVKPNVSIVEKNDYRDKPKNCTAIIPPNAKISIHSTAGDCDEIIDNAECGLPSEYAGLRTKKIYINDNENKPNEFKLYKSFSFLEGLLFNIEFYYLSGNYNKNIIIENDKLITSSKFSIFDFFKFKK